MCQVGTGTFVYRSSELFCGERAEAASSCGRLSAPLRHSTLRPREPRSCYSASWYLILSVTCERIPIGRNYFAKRTYWRKGHMSLVIANVVEAAESPRKIGSSHYHYFQLMSECAIFTTYAVRLRL